MRKAEILTRPFGDHGFSYEDNIKCDLDIWKRAADSVRVGVSSSLTRKTASPARLEHQVKDYGMTVTILLRAIRIHQWAKNLLVFVPIVTSGSFLVVNDWINAVLLFIAFSCTASSIYITNDICDLDADRNHPRKSKRPFASGDLPISAGLLLCPILLLCGLSIGVVIGAWLYLLSYVGLAIAYSAKAKTFPLVDVFILAALYMVRLFAGGEVTGHPVSMWLLAFSGFVFLGLALLKRVS